MRSRENRIQVEEGELERNFIARHRKEIIEIFGRRKF